MLKKLAMFAAQKLSGQGKTTGKEAIKFIKPDVGKLKKTQDAKKKITDITDKYAVGFAKDDPKLLKKFRKNSKKNLDSISKISKRKTNVQKIKETFAPKKPGNVPSKFKGFSKLPEKVQQKINKKLAKKV